MESKTKLLGHSIHQSLVAFPVGLLATSTLFDIIHAFSGGTTSALVAFWMLAAGIVGAVVAAPFGLIDWLAIPSNTRAKRIGAIHGAGNVIVLVLYAVSWWIRRDVAVDPPGASLVLSVIGVLVIGCTGWLGGELVTRLGIGVSDHAGLDAPSSLDSVGPREPARLKTSAEKF